MTWYDPENLVLRLFAGAEEGGGMREGVRGGGRGGGRREEKRRSNHLD